MNFDSKTSLFEIFFCEEIYHKKLEGAGGKNALSPVQNRINQVFLPHCVNDDIILQIKLCLSSVFLNKIQLIELTTTAC